MSGFNNDNPLDKPGLLGLRLGGVCSLLLVWALALFGLGGSPLEAATPSLEYQAKAGYIYKLTFFTRWPAGTWNSKEDPIRIGIIDRGEFGDIFEGVADKQVNGRRLQVERIDANAPGDLGRFQLIYIEPGSELELDEVVRQLAGRPVLLVGDASNFLEEGGMVNLGIRNNRIALEIQRSNAARVGINFNARLLRVAYRVEED